MQLSAQGFFGRLAPECHRGCAELGPFRPGQRVVVASIAYPRLPVRIRTPAGLGIMTANVVARYAICQQVRVHHARPLEASKSKPPHRS